MSGAFGGRPVQRPAWPIYGTGNAGDVTISGGTTSLTAEKSYRTLTIASTGILQPQGRLVTATKRIVIAASGSIERKGGNASGATGGNSPTAGVFGGAMHGSASGGTGAGASGNHASNYYCPAGIKGGNGGAGTGGAGGTWNDDVTTSNHTSEYAHSRLLTALSAGLLYQGNARYLVSASGGKAGGGNGVQSGGGGGGPGCIIILAAPVIEIQGAARSIDARGGDAGAGTAADCGGGGGGAGGAVFLICERLILGGALATLIDVAGGALGASGGGSGVAGVAGANGYIYYPIEAL